MSFLPYAKPPAGVWAASVGGASALHGGIAVVLLTSSVAFLPEPTAAPSRAPDFEVTLRILDADIIEALKPAPDAPLIPPDAVPLTPDAPVAEPLRAVRGNLVPPDDTGADLIAPSDGGLAAPLPDIAAQQSEPEVLPDVAAPLEQAQGPVLTPIDPEPPQDEIIIDSINPVDGGEISPLAQAVAPPPSASETGVGLPPETVPGRDQAGLILPEEPQMPLAIPPITEPDTNGETAQPDILQPTIAVPDEIAPQADTPGPEAQPTPPVPDIPEAPQTLASPDPITQAIGTLLQRIRATPAPVCTLALPRRAGPDGVGVSFIGSQVTTLDTFAAQVLRDMSPVPVQTREVIDPRQCALLDVVRQIADYPAGRIGLTLEDTTLQSGENLRGQVIGAGGLFVTLLLIDDNGVVQDMARFTSVAGGDPVFDAPVARAGPARATRQVLLALGSAQGPIDVSAQIGQTAETVFSALPADLLDQIVFGLATFDVR